MKPLIIVLVLLSTAAFGQIEDEAIGSVPERKSQPPVQQGTTDTQNYAPYYVALLLHSGGEAVFPFLTPDNKVTFFPLSVVQQASKDKRLLGRPISYGDLLVVIGDLQIQVNQLKGENEKLWAAIGKSSPQTVVVQPAPAAIDPTKAEIEARKTLLMRYFLQRSMPTPTLNMNVSDCTRYPALCVH